MPKLPDRIETKSDYHAFLAADLRANKITRWRFQDRFREPVVMYLRLLRRVEYLKSQPGPLPRALRFWARFRMQSIGVRTGITLPPGVAGAGISIAHYGTVVVNSRARIGKWCRLHPGVTLGIANGGVPSVGDHVYIGPNAVIYGDIRIGNRAVVGANAVVNRDVPDGATVAGAPARVVSDRDSTSVMPEWMPRSE